MPSTRRELKMHCGGCDGRDKCIDLPRLLGALRGFSRETCRRAIAEFELRSCGSGSRLPREEVGPLCVQVLVADPAPGSDGLTDLQSVAANAAQKLIRVRIPHASTDDIWQTAIASALELTQPPGQLLIKFDIEKKARNGSPTTVSGYVIQAVAWHALEQLRRQLGIRRIQTRGKTVYEDPLGNAEPLDVIEDDERTDEPRYGIGIMGAIRSSYPVASQDGRSIQFREMLATGFHPTGEDPFDAERQMDGVRRFVLDQQRDVFNKVVDAIPARGNERFMATALVLKAAVELDPTFFPRGIDGDIVGKRVAQAADYPNFTLWCRRHALGLLKEAVTIDAGVANGLRLLCGWLDALDGLYVGFPHAAPAEGTQKWSTRVFHVLARADVRAVLPLLPNN